MTENPYQSPTTPSEGECQPLTFAAYLTAVLNFVAAFIIAVLVGCLGQAALLRSWLFIDATWGWRVACYWIGVLSLAGLLGSIRAVSSLKKARGRAARSSFRQSRPPGGPLQRRIRVKNNSGPIFPFSPLIFPAGDDRMPIVKGVGPPNLTIQTL